MNSRYHNYQWNAGDLYMKMKIWLYWGELGEESRTKLWRNKKRERWKLGLTIVLWDEWWEGKRRNEKLCEILIIRQNPRLLLINGHDLSGIIQIQRSRLVITNLGPRAFIWTFTSPPPAHFVFLPSGVWRDVKVKKKKRKKRSFTHQRTSTTWSSVSVFKF